MVIKDRWVKDWKGDKLSKHLLFIELNVWSFYLLLLILDLF